MNNETKFPFVKQFSKAIGISEARLIQAYQIEKEFHYAIMSEQDFKKRLNLYRNVYNTVHPIYGKTSQNITLAKNPKTKQVKLFRKELSGKSILDVGCGQGYFLASIATQLKHKRLVGIDVSVPEFSQQHTGIEFISADIIDFTINEEFDVVFADQVFEHIAPCDVEMHLTSIKNSLRKGGTFIMCLPNRLFGPSDVTRIIDFTCTNKIEAQGTHLNESTYTELIPILKNQGFDDFRTIVSIPKIRHLLYYLRISPSIFLAIERSKLLINILYYFKFRGR